jgi:hypothetical protein
LAVLNPDTGAVIYTAEIGSGNDDLVFDADTYRPLEAFGTQAGVRTMVLHPTSVSPYCAHTFSPHWFFVLTYGKSLALGVAVGAGDTLGLCCESGPWLSGLCSQLAHRQPFWTQDDVALCAVR